MTETIRVQLEDRRQLLVSAIARRNDDAELNALLREVDLALGRVEAGTFGLCETCHDPIEADRLSVDPLIRRCLDHLTVEETRAIERDLRLAGEVQAALLPRRDLEWGGWEIAFEFLPHGAVSGDYCDVVLPSDWSGAPALVLLGDISGKGVAASMLMTHLHALVRSMAGLGLGMCDLLNRVNRSFCESTLPSHYATLVAASLSESGGVEFANAGHIPPLLVGDGRVARIEEAGLPIGMFCAADRRTTGARLEPGHSVVLVTDGLTEATNVADEEYGLGRMSRLLEASGPRTARDTVEIVLRDARRFTEGLPWADDAAVLVARRL